jgi:hypothetical protein
MNDGPYDAIVVCSWHNGLVQVLERSGIIEARIGLCHEL